MDGSSVEPLVTPSSDPSQIKLDATAGKIYWAEDPTGSRIMRANLDGSGAEPLIEVETGVPHGIALDVSNNHLYWMNIETSTIHRSNLDGTGTVDLLTTGISPIDLALDLVHGQMYWTENGQDNRHIRRANLDGTGIETLVTGLGNPLGIALDIAADKMYWADNNRLKIQRANLDGSDVEDVLSDLDHSPTFIALDVPIPEPGTLVLLAMGIAVVLYRKRRTAPE